MGRFNDGITVRERRDLRVVGRRSNPAVVDIGARNGRGHVLPSNHRVRHLPRLAGVRCGGDRQWDLQGGGDLQWKGRKHHHAVRRVTAREEIDGGTAEEDGRPSGPGQAPIFSAQADDVRFRGLAALRDCQARSVRAALQRRYRTCWRARC